MKKITLLFSVLILAFAANLQANELKSAVPLTDNLEVVSYTPGNYSADVPLDTEIKLGFNQEITLAESPKVELFYTNLATWEKVYLEISYKVEGAFLIIEPQEALPYLTELTAAVYSGALEGLELPNDWFGNPGSIQWFFTTAENPNAPQKVSHLPAESATDVPVDAAISITFDKEIEIADATQISVTGYYGDYATIAITPRVEGSTLYIDHDALLNETSYGVRVNSDAVKAKGTNDANGAAINYSFTTVVNVNKPIAIAYTPPSDGPDNENIAIDTEIKIEFDRDIELVDASAISLASGFGDDRIFVNITPSAQGKVLSIAHDDLAYETLYTFTVNPGAIKDGHTYSSTFTTEENPDKPKLTSSTPRNDATGVSINTVIELVFDKDIELGDNPYYELMVAGFPPSFVEGLAHQIAGNKFTITYTGPLAYSTSYNLTINPGTIKDASYLNVNFTTEDDPDATLSVQSYTPQADATNVAITTAVQVTFNKAITRGENVSVSFTKESEPNTNLNALFSIDNNVLSVGTDGILLNYNTKYNVHIAAGSIADYDKDIAWSFTTLLEPLTVVSRTPEADAINVPVDTEMVIEYSNTLVEIEGSGDFRGFITATNGENPPNMFTGYRIDGKRLYIEHETLVAGQEYIVELIISNIQGIPSYTFWKFTTESGAKLGETEDLEVSVYSNPTAGCVHVIVPDDATIYLSDLTGKLCRTIVAKKGEVCTIYQEAGVYLLNVRSEKESYATKVIFR